MKNALVIGCNRSGTSVTMQALAKNGYHMGESFILEGSGNSDALFEDHDVRRTNIDLINSVIDPQNCYWPAYTGWLIPAPWDATFREQKNSESVIQRIVSQKPFCFKDPLFCVTLEVWRPFLEECVFVMLFRHPSAVVASMLRPHEGTFKQNGKLQEARSSFYTLWEHINRNVIDGLSQKGDWLFLHLDQLTHGTGLTRLREFTQGAVDSSVFNPSKQHPFKPGSEPTPKSSLLVYEKLCQLANFHE